MSFLSGDVFGDRSGKDGRTRPLTLKALARDPWSAVYFDMGAEPDLDLVREAHFWAEYCYEGARCRAENLNWIGKRAFEPRVTECGVSGTPARHAEAALRRLVELESIDPMLKRRAPV